MACRNVTFARRDHALQRTAAGRRGCNSVPLVRRVAKLGSFGRHGNVFRATASNTKRAAQATPLGEPPKHQTGDGSMKMRHPIAGISVLTCLLFLTPSVCLAVADIETVSKDRAKELGLEVRANAAGSDTVRVELEFEAKSLPSYSRVDLDIRDGGKLLLSCSLRE